jgi:type I restriction enzyme R subunit
MHPLKEDTFVLDFVNDRDEIREAFKDYYDGAEMGEEAEPNQMYAIKAELDASGIYTHGEVDRFVAVYFKPRQRQSPADHQAMNAPLDQAVDRFRELQLSDEEAAELWRGKLQAFRNLYAFLSQVIPYQDSDLERLYTYLRFLSTKLPRRESGPRYDFDDEVRLEYYRLQKISEGSISLRDGKGNPLDGPKAVGSGLQREEETPLSKLIDTLNDRFGTDFTDADQLFFDQIIEAAVGDASLGEAAAVNPEAWPCARAGCAAGSPAGSGRARSRPRWCRSSPMPRRCCPARPGRRRSGGSPPTAACGPSGRSPGVDVQHLQRRSATAAVMRPSPLTSA